MKLRRFLLIFSLVALFALVFTTAVSAKEEEMELNTSFFEAVSNDECPKKDFVPNLFDGDIKSDGLSGYNNWHGVVGDYVLITFREEIEITGMDIYVTGNYTWADVEFFNSKGDVIHSVTGDSYDKRIVANENPYGSEGVKKVVFQPGDLRGDEELKSLFVKQIKLTISSLKWADKSLNEHMRTYTLSEIKLKGMHEHLCEIDGEIITYPTCAKDGLREALCWCGKMGTKPIPATGNHSIDERIVFRNGFTEPGYKTVICRSCDTQDVLDYEGKIDIGPLFSTLGYSVREDGKSGVQLGIMPNLENIEFYNSIADTPLQFGTISGSRNVLAEGNPLIIDENSNVKAISDKLVLKDCTNLGYSIISSKISGFGSDYHNTELILSAYVYDGYDIYYLGSETSSDVSTVSYNGLLGIIPEAPSGDVEAGTPKEE